MVGADGVGAAVAVTAGRRAGAAAASAAGEGADQPRDPQHHQREEGQDDQQGDAAAAHVLRLATDDHRFAPSLGCVRTRSRAPADMPPADHALTSP